MMTLIGQGMGNSLHSPPGTFPELVRVASPTFRDRLVEMLAPHPRRMPSTAWTRQLPPHLTSHRPEQRSRSLPRVGAPVSSPPADLPTRPHKPCLSGPGPPLPIYAPPTPRHRCSRPIFGLPLRRLQPAGQRRYSVASKARQLQRISIMATPANISCLAASDSPCIGSPQRHFSLKGISCQSNPCIFSYGCFNPSGITLCGSSLPSARPLVEALATGGSPSGCHPLAHSCGPSSTASIGGLPRPIPMSHAPFQ